MKDKPMIKTLWQSDLLWILVATFILVVPMLMLMPDFLNIIEILDSYR